MVGTLFQVTMVGLLAAAPSGGFTFEGIQASARTTSPVGYFAQGTTPYPNIYERGTGSATLTAEDRVPAWGATYGDKGRVEAEFRLGQAQYRVELTQPGFPPQQASGGSPAPRPSFPVAGGVLLDHDLNGASGLGWMATTQVHAAVVVWGVGSVWRNGQLITDTALIQAAALSHGSHADDETHRILAAARAGDTELDVLVWNLPQSAEPRGFLQFSFDDVEIELNDRPVNSVAVVPNVQGVESGGVVPVTGGFGGNGIFVAPTPAPAPGQGVGGSGFDVTAPPQTGTPGGPVTPVSPGTLGGPASANLGATPGVSVGTEATQQGTAATGSPGVPSQPVTGPVTSVTTVGPGAVTPDTISGTFPTLGAPTPPANISGSMPGTPAPGSLLATEQTVVPGTPAPGAPAEAGVAINSTTPTLSNSGNFTVPISPPNFNSFAGTGQVSPGIIATAPPIGTDPTIPTPPLLGSPAPLTAASGTPLLGTPAPLTAAPPPALITTPAPVNATPGSTTAAPVAPIPGIPATSAPVTSPGSTGVPPSI
ncbi:hypothetical protein [Hyalangium minutum]|uniref:Extensin-like protein n=1 Tax=Hyalangium minutum TaxID=394096 RepID=A0A085WAA2_9BACT|nr:hypothetical protein [Hyalangium minutum]KFE64615.1 Extensin-like protein precursor [Hyalangium minutum]